ncbi:MAG: glycosyltransferase family 4 protein [Acidobacteria bacterium]|nr:glycosyltransferase family 4 protein [Acidobacteriota bacterium]
MTILHLDSETGWSGGQTQVAALVAYLAGCGHRNVVGCPGDSRLAGWCRQKGVPAIAVSMRHDLDVAAIRAIRRALRDQRPNIVHMHTARAHALGALAHLLAGRLAVMVVTRRMDYRLRHPRLNRPLYNRLVDHVVAISSGARAGLLASGVREDHMEIIHSSVDTHRFVPVDSGPARKQWGLAPADRVAGVVGTLVPRKCHSVLLDAWPAVRARVPAARLLVAGDGPLRARLEQQAVDLSLTGSVIFLGQVADIRDVLASLDVLVLPSRKEGLGVSILEGMAMGVPVVASAVGGIPDAVRDGVNGFLVPPEEPAALAERLADVLTDPALAGRFGRAGREIVCAEFTVEQMGRRYEELYRRLLVARSASSG